MNKLLHCIHIDQTSSFSGAVVMSILLGYQNRCDDDIFSDNRVSILPSHEIQFLILIIDDSMTFSANVDVIISKGDSRFFYYANRRSSA